MRSFLFTAVNNRQMVYLAGESRTSIIQNNPNKPPVAMLLGICIFLQALVCFKTCNLTTSARSCFKQIKEIVIKPVPNRTDYGRYATFGFVIEGMDVAYKIVAVQRDRAINP